jgi:hypothetical protein
MPEAAIGDRTMMAQKQRSAWSEAGRPTFGLVYWSLTALLTLATIASWIWGDGAVRFAVSATAVVFVFVAGAVHQRRMNRIDHERRIAHEGDPREHGGE